MKILAHKTVCPPGNLRHEILRSLPDYGFPPGYLHHATEGQLLHSGLALVGAGMGFRATWFDADTKRPYTRHGIKDATLFGTELYQQWEALPDGRNYALAITMPPGTATLDIDSGNPWTLRGRPDRLTATESTVRGWHQFVSLPVTIDYTRRHAVGELRAGPDSAVLIAPSPGKKLFILGGNPNNTRWFRALPEDGAIWLDYLRAAAMPIANSNDETGRTDSPPILTTANDLEIATSVLDMMIAGSFGATIEAIVMGDHNRYNSRSEADFALVYMATHFVTDPAILAALLASHSKKLRDIPDSHQQAYISRTIIAAIRSRQLTNVARLNTIAHSIQLAPYPLATTLPGYANAKDVYVAEKWEPGAVPGLEGLRKGQRREALIAGILAWAGMVGNGDGFDRDGGWRRLPVDDFAAMFGYTRDGIRRVYLGLMDAGLIEREVPNTGSDKGPRNTTLIRLARR